MTKTNQIGISQPSINPAEAIFKTEDAGGEAAPLKWLRIALRLTLQQMPEAQLMTKQAGLLTADQVRSCHYQHVGGASLQPYLQYGRMHHHGGDALLLDCAKRRDRYLQLFSQWTTDSA